MADQRPREKGRFVKAHDSVDVDQSDESDGQDESLSTSTTGLVDDISGAGPFILGGRGSPLQALGYDDRPVKVEISSEAIVQSRKFRKSPGRNNATP